MENIARYYHHETVRVHGEIDDTLGNIRRGLMKACRRTTFRQRSFKAPGASASESQGPAVAGLMGATGWGDKESERQGLLQRHRKEVVVDCGKEDGEQRDGKPS